MIMKTINLSVVLLMFAFILLSATGCATNYSDANSPVPWDRPDVLDTGAMPSTGSWTR